MMKLSILVTFAWVAITLVSAVPTNGFQSIKPAKSTENIREITGAKNNITAGSGGKRSIATSSVGRMEKSNQQQQHVSEDGKMSADSQTFDGNVTKSKSLRSSSRKNSTIPLKSGSERKLSKKRVSKRALRGKRTSKRTLQEKRATRRTMRKKRASKRTVQKDGRSRRALRKKRMSKQSLQDKHMSRKALRKMRTSKRTSREKRMSRRVLRKKRVSKRTLQKQRMSKQTLQNNRNLRKKSAVHTRTRPLEKHSPLERSTGTHLVEDNSTNPLSILSEITEHAAKAVMTTLKPNMRTDRAETDPSTESISEPLSQTEATKELKKPKRRTRTARKKRSPWTRKTRPKKRRAPKRSSSTQRTPPPSKPKSKRRQRTNPNRQARPPLTSIRVNRQCFCRLVTTARKRCYVFTNEEAGKCKSRWCPYEWECIKTGHTKNVCIPEVKTEKVELIPGSRSSCRRLKHQPRTSWVFYKRLKMFTL